MIPGYSVGRPHSLPLITERGRMPENTPITGIKACVFDAYGTIFDVHSAVGRHRHRLGDKADPVSMLWRTKQLEYTWLRSLMGRHADFWQVTREALDFAFDMHRIDDPDLHREEFRHRGSDRNELLRRGGGHLQTRPPGVPAGCRRSENEAGGNRLPIVQCLGCRRRRGFRFQGGLGEPLRAEPGATAGESGCGNSKPLAIAGASWIDEVLKRPGWSVVSGPWVSFLSAVMPAYETVPQFT